MQEGKDWFLVIWAVVCIAVVLGMSYWVTRYLAGSRMLGAGIGRSGKGRIKIIEQQMLGRDQRLIVVQVGEKRYLLGMTSNNISMLAEISWDPTQEDAEESSDTQDSGPPAFRDAFRIALRQKTRR